MLAQSYLKKAPSEPKTFAKSLLSHSVRSQSHRTGQTRSEKENERERAEKLRERRRHSDRREQTHKNAKSATTPTGNLATPRCK